MFQAMYTIYVFLCVFVCYLHICALGTLGLTHRQMYEYINIIKFQIKSKSMSKSEKVRVKARARGRASKRGREGERKRVKRRKRDEEIYVHEFIYNDIQLQHAALCAY